MSEWFQNHHTRAGNCSLPIRRFSLSRPALREGRINLSPKGMDTFRVASSRRVLYLDLTGSGNETAAHLLDDGRITIMFCSFDKTARIIRLCWPRPLLFIRATISGTNTSQCSLLNRAFGKSW